MKKIDPITQYILERETLQELTPELVLTHSLIMLYVLKQRQLREEENKIIKEKCKKLSFKEKLICINKVRLDVTNKKLVELKKLYSKCSKTKNPEKCKERLDKEKIKLEKRINSYKSKLKSNKTMSLMFDKPL